MKEVVLRIKKELFYAGLNREAYHKVSNAVWESNRIAIIVWSIFAALFWIMSLVMSLNADAYKACRTVYIIALIICVVMLVGALFLVRRVSWMLFPITFLFVLYLHCAGIGIAICQPDVRTVTLIVFSTITPISTIKRTSSTIVMQCVIVFLYVLLAKDVIEPDIYSWELTNLIIFSVVGLLVGHFINRARFERYVFAESAMQLAELQTRYAYYDQMTGLQNRRAYSEKVEQLSKQLPVPCTVVMADINGLKEANDTLGHEAGDELIIGSAECLRKNFDGIDTVYRLGGDEFTVIMERPETEVKKCLERMEKNCADWKGQFINGISISYGIASTEEFSDLDFLLKEADRRMYEYKSNYYQNAGKDRRRR